VLIALDVDLCVA